MKIKYFILPILLLSNGAYAINSKYKCDQVIFSGLDLSHRKSVKVCLSGKNISYTFGRINSPKNDLDMLVAPNKTGWDYYVNGENKKAFIKTIIVKSGPYTYRMTTGNNPKGLQQSFITVHKGDINTPISIIPIDPKTVINQVSPLLRNYGIPYVKDKMYEYKKRNPADTFYFS